MACRDIFDGPLLGDILQAVENCIMQLFIPPIHADLASHFARHLIFPGPSHRREDLSTNKINALF